MQPLDNNAQGMLVGLAIGDALGANLEFTIVDHTDINDEKIGLYDGMWPKGAWTDDTSMALCLGKSLLERGGYDSYDVMQKYQRWVEEGYCSSDGRPAGDVGTQVRAAIEEFKTNPAIERGSPRSERAGNGTLMRLAPVVIATAHSPIADTVKLAQISARETHYSNEAEAGAEIFAAMLRRVMEADRDTDKTQLVDVGQFSTGTTYDDILDRVILDSALDRQVYLEDLDGYVVNALTIATWGFRNFTSFAEGMRAVIKLGGDTDTNGAIYGQLAGAYYGYDQIPSEWKSDLLRETEIRKLADQLLAMGKCPVLRTRFAEDE